VLDRLAQALSRVKRGQNEPATMTGELDVYGAERVVLDLEGEEEEEEEEEEDVEEDVEEEGDEDG
jgi:hypothetical protein